MQSSVDELLGIGDLVKHPMWSSAADALVLVDVDGRIRSTNPSCQQLLGYDDGQLEGRLVETLVPDECAQAHAQHRADYERDPKPRSMAASRLLEAKCANGSTLPVAISLSRIETAQGPYTIAAIRDLTERVTAEENAAELHHKRLLAEEHDRIARELHDTAIQKLYALGMSLQVSRDNPDRGDLQQRLTDSIRAVDDTIALVQAAIRDLKASQPPGEGVRHQILNLVAEMEDALGFSPRVSISGPLDAVLTPAVAAEAFPVLREALANVARHAHATAADVRIEATGESLRVTVADNGRGMGSVTRRSGLKNLAKRATILNGTLDVESPGQGTTLNWVVPLDGINRD